MPKNTKQKSNYHECHFLLQIPENFFEGDFKKLCEIHNFERQNDMWRLTKHYFHQIVTYKSTSLDECAFKRKADKFKIIFEKMDFDFKRLDSNRVLSQKELKEFLWRQE